MQFDFSFIHFAVLMFCLVSLLAPFASSEDNAETAISSAAASPLSPSEDKSIVDVEELSRDNRDTRPKYAPGYRTIGIGKRADSEVRPQKYGPSYRTIGIGKRGNKYSPSYKYIGIGKRDGDAAVKPKYSPGYRYIGIGKRMAPYWSSQLLANFKDVFGENKNANTFPSQHGVMRPIYSVVSKKLTPEDEEFGTMFSAEVDSVTTAAPVVGDGRPSARGGYYEPIYRYVGIGR